MKKVCIDKRNFSKFELEKFLIENNSLWKVVKSLIEYAKELLSRWIKYHKSSMSVNGCFRMKTIFKLNKIWTGFMTAGFLSTVCYSNVLHNVLYHEVIEYIELLNMFLFMEKRRVSFPWNIIKDLCADETFWEWVVWCNGSQQGYFFFFNF